MMNKSKIFRTVIAAVTGGMFLGAIINCASIIHGTKQEVGISSTPSSAKVIIDDKEMGSTPVTVKLKRKKNHTVKLQLPGYHDYEATLTRKVSGWVWGNLVFGGLIGLGVDAISGGLYRLHPEDITGQLAAKQAAVEEVGSSTEGEPISQADSDEDTLHIAIVLKADPSWEKIGQLRKVASLPVQVKRVF